MPSPFPGMDPYLEDTGIWPDFHTTFLLAIRKAITHILPARYSVVVERHVWIQESEDEGWCRVRPDVHVTELHQEEQRAILKGEPLTAPATVILPTARPEGPVLLQIIDRHTHRVITVIEMLSPANKLPGADREAYLTKRNDYLARGMNFVEIDFLRCGERMPGIEQVADAADYYILVGRTDQHPRARVWPLLVRDLLPVIPIPLLPSDDELKVSLRACLDADYNDAQYNRETDYTRPPT